MLHFLLLWIFVLSSAADPIAPGVSSAGSAGQFKTHETEYGPIFDDDGKTSLTSQTKNSNGQRGSSYIFHSQGQQPYATAGTSAPVSTLGAPSYPHTSPQLLASSGTSGSSSPVSPYATPGVTAVPAQSGFAYPQAYNLQSPNPYLAYPQSTVQYATPPISQSGSPPSGYAPQGFLAAHHSPQAPSPPSVLPQSAHYGQPIYYTGGSTGAPAYQAASVPPAAHPGAFVHAGITYVPAPGQVGPNQAAYTFPAGYPSGQPSPAYATYAPPPSRPQQKTGDLNVPSDYYSPSSYLGQTPGGLSSGASVYSQPPSYYAPQAISPTQVSQAAALPSPYHVYGRSQIPPEALYRYFVPHTGHPTAVPQPTQPLAPAPVQPTYPSGAALVGDFANIFARQAPSFRPSSLYRSFVDLGYTGASIYGTPMYSKASPGPGLSKYVSPQYYSATVPTTAGTFSYTHNSLRDTRAAAAALGHDGSSSRPYVVGASSYEAPTYADTFVTSTPERFASLQASNRGVRYIKKK